LAHARAVTASFTDAAPLAVSGTMPEPWPTPLPAPAPRPAPEPAPCPLPCRNRFRYHFLNRNRPLFPNLDRCPCHFPRHCRFLIPCRSLPLRRFHFLFPNRCRSCSTTVPRSASSALSLSLGVARQQAPLQRWAADQGRFVGTALCAVAAHRAKSAHAQQPGGGVARVTGWAVGCGTGTEEIGAGSGRGAPVAVSLVAPVSALAVSGQCAVWVEVLPVALWVALRGAVVAAWCAARRRRWFDG
jgi:hypothetical protein